MSAVQPRSIIVFTISGTTYRKATEGFYDSSDNWHEGSLLEYPELRSRLQERVWGTYARETVRLACGNTDETWHALFTGHELRGLDVTIQYYDATAGGAPTTQCVGQIVSIDVRDQVFITVELRRFDVLETLIPTKVVNTTDFPYATDLGAAIPIISGHAKAVPLRYVHKDYDNDYYDYLICEPGTNQTVDSVAAVYRKGTIVHSDEYTFYDGTQGSPHGGYAFLRFSLEQRDHDGHLCSLTADVNMGSRDFADYIKEILEESAWGLGETANSTSFTAATAALAGLDEPLYCDGAVTVQTKARDVLEELVKLCRGHLDLNTSGEWTLDIDDAYDSTSSADFGYKDGYYNNILEIKERGSISLDLALKSYTLQYGRQGKGEELIYENTRSVFSFGLDRIDRTDFVNDHTTADMITCWRKNLALYSDKDLVIVVGEEGRDLAVRDRVTIHVPDWSISSALYRIEDKIQRESKVELYLKQYSSGIYSYSEGSMPSNAKSSIQDSYGIGSAQQPSDAYLVGHWSCNNDGSTTILLDNSGGGQTLSAGSAITFVDGIAGDAIDGNEALTGTPATPLANAVKNGDIVFSFWWTPREEYDYRKIIQFDTNEGEGTFRIRHNNDNSSYASLMFGYRKDGSNYYYAYTNAIFNYNERVHVVCLLARTSETFRLYVNGVPVTTTTKDSGGGMPTFSSCTVIDFFPSGDLDDYLEQVRIYNTCLTRAEIWALYSQPAGNPARVTEWSGIGGYNLPADNATENLWYIQETEPSGTDGDHWYKPSAYTAYVYDSGWTTFSNNYTQLSQMLGDVDDLTDGEYYIRAPAAWKYTGTVEIDGGVIRADTVLAGSLAVTTLSAITENVGTLYAGVIRSNNSGIYWDLTNGYMNIDGDQLNFTGCNGTTIIDSYGDGWWVSNTYGFDSATIRLDAGSSPYAYMKVIDSGITREVRVVNSAFYPNSTSLTLGDPSYYWGDAYLGDIHLGASGYIEGYTDASNYSRASFYSGASEYIAFTVISAGSSGVIYISEDQIKSTTDNLYYNGTVGKSWKAVYSYAYYDEDGVSIVDDQPDLDILHAMVEAEDIEPRDGIRRVGLMSLPDLMTNKKDLREKIRRDNGDLVSDEDFEEMVQDYDNLGSMLRRRLGGQVDYNSGAIRELDHKLIREVTAVRTELQELRASIPATVH